MKSIILFTTLIILAFSSYIILGCENNYPSNRTTENDTSPSNHLYNTENTPITINSPDTDNNNSPKNDSKEEKTDETQLNYKDFLIGDLQTSDSPIDESTLENDDKSSIEKWSNQMKNNASKFYESVLSIYTNGDNHLGKNSNYVKDLFNKAITVGSTKKDALGSDIISRDTISDKDLMTSIVRRYPIYFGHPITSRYIAHNVKTVLGYDVANDKFMEKVNPHTRFALLGKAYVNKNFDHNAKPNNPDYLYIIHTWGVNLESTDTADYKRFVNSNNNKLKRPEYAIEVGRMVENIMIAALKVVDKESKKVYIRTTGIGLGAFLSTIKDPKDKVFAKRLLLEIMAYLSDIPQYSKINIDFCMRNGMPDINKNPYAAKKINDDNFNIINNGDLYNLSTYTKNNDIVIIVNAWDNRSPIGNGGKDDNTIDGMTVAAISAGNKMPNTSFLGNQWFNTEKKPIRKYKSNIKDEFFTEIAKRLNNID